MTESADFTLGQVLEIRQEELLNAWMNSVLLTWRRKYPHTAINEDLLRLQSRQLLDELRKLFSGAIPPEGWEPVPGSKIATLLYDFSVKHAKHGIKHNDTVLYISVIKQLLIRALLQDAPPACHVLNTLIISMDHVLDRLTVTLYDAYLETRERIIAQQSLSLLELSTPVVRLWDRVVMVPLIGVIDTQRARQITERLLEAIAKYEATVAILDVTGVPVLDTSVAGHIMKTIAAAQMLGAQVVMTGINPDGAQTLVKLGVNFAEVTTRATLRAGIAEGLLRVGKRIVPIKE